MAAGGRQVFFLLPLFSPAFFSHEFSFTAFFSLGERKNKKSLTVQKKAKWLPLLSQGHWVDNKSLGIEFNPFYFFCRQGLRLPRASEQRQRPERGEVLLPGRGGRVRVRRGLRALREEQEDLHGGWGVVGQPAGVQWVQSLLLWMAVCNRSSIDISLWEERLHTAIHCGMLCNMF